MHEIFYPKEKINVEGGKHLEAVRVLNEEGKFVVFAPNHLYPPGNVIGKVRRWLGLAEDHPAFERVLSEYGIKSQVVIKGDTNMYVGESFLKKMRYDLATAILTRIRQVVTGGLVINNNPSYPGQVIASNRQHFRAMVEAVQKQTNIVIYPYGNWYASGEQRFETSEDLKDGESFCQRPPHTDTEAVARWMNSLKRGFINLARRSKVPIIPVYIEQGEEDWTIRFGAPISTEGENKVEVAKRYLEAMRNLKGSGESVKV